MVPHEMQEDLISRLVIYAVGIPTAAMGWLNENSNGITAICTVIATSILVWRFWRDWRRGRRRD